MARCPACRQRGAALHYAQHIAALHYAQHIAALHYAQHIKDEIIQGLSYQDAMVVMQRAADEAQAEVRGQLAANVKAEGADEESLRLKAWCEGHANDFIAAFIDAHDSGHVAFLEQVRALKVE